MRELVQSATYRGVAVGSLGEEGSKTRVGRLQTERMAKLDVEKVVGVVKTRATPLLHSSTPASPRCTVSQRGPR